MIGDLKPGTEYRVSIAAYSQTGKGKLSFPQHVTTLPQGKIRLKSINDGKGPPFIYAFTQQTSHARDYLGLCEASGGHSKHASVLSDLSRVRQDTD